MTVPVFTPAPAPVFVAGSPAPAPVSVQVPAPAPVYVAGSPAPVTLPGKLVVIISKVVLKIFLREPCNPEC